MRPDNPILDGEKLFRQYYLEMGTARSIAKLRDQMTLQGVIHPKTNKPVTTKAVQDSMWSWALRNLEVAYKMFNEAAYHEGSYITPEQFEKEVQHHAWRIMKAKRDDRKFQKWLKKRGKEQVWQSPKQNASLTST